MQNAVINLNGQIVNPNDAKVSVFDRGYLYGDSLYEVVRSYNGEFFLLNEHLTRLEKSAELCKMDLQKPVSFFQAEIERTFRAFRSQGQNSHLEAYARIVISRGVGRIGFGRSCITSPIQYTIFILPVEPPTSEQIENGMKLRVVRRLRNDARALDPAMKSGNYLNSLLAYLEANEDDFPDALLCNADGHITEGTTFNIFYVRRGILATPPLDIGILDGITRKKVIQLAHDLNLRVREVRFPKERLYEADEVFLTSSIREVLPISQVDEKRIGNGKPGPVTIQLRNAYQKCIQQGKP